MTREMTRGAMALLRRNSTHSMSYFRWVPNEGAHEFTFRDGSQMRLPQVDLDIFRENGYSLIWSMGHKSPDFAKLAKCPKITQQMRGVR
jgi:hypothetical protein